jgi:hypothetical protein
MRLVPVGLSLSDANVVEVRFEGGAMEPTGLYAHQYFAGDPPMVDEVELFYFAEASLFVRGGEIWIAVSGGTNAHDVRAAGAPGWYVRTAAERYEPRDAPSTSELALVARLETVPWWRKPRRSGQ